MNTQQTALAESPDPPRAHSVPWDGSHPPPAPERSHIVGPRGCPGHDVRTPGCSWCDDETELNAFDAASEEEYTGRPGKRELTNASLGKMLTRARTANGAGALVCILEELVSWRSEMHPRIAELKRQHAAMSPTDHKSPDEAADDAAEAAEERWNRDHAGEHEPRSAF